MDDDEDDDMESETGGGTSAGLLSVARKLVRYFHKSIQALEKLKHYQKNVNKMRGKEPGEGLDVICDVVTGWWSTLCMIDRLRAEASPDHVQC